MAWCDICAAISVSALPRRRQWRPGPCLSWQASGSQYHKEGRALRIETTINDTRDFIVGRLLRNLPELRSIGFAANRRMLEIEQISHDCALGEAAFQDLQRPRNVDGQRAAAPRFADPKVQALLHGLVMFVFVARGFSSQDLQQAYAVLLGLAAGARCWARCA